MNVTPTRGMKAGALITALILLALVAGSALGLAAFRPAAEVDGYGAIQTVSQQVFNQVTSAVPSSTVRNVGQSEHQVMYCALPGTGAVNSVAIQLEASFDGNTWMRISDIGTAISGCSLLEAGGYFPNVRVNLVTLGVTGNGSLSAWYSGASSPISNAGQGTLKNRATGSPLYGNSTTLGHAYADAISFTNPGAGAQLLTLVSGSSTKTVYLDKATITSTAATTITMFGATGGSSCTGTGSVNQLTLPWATQNVPSATLEWACSTPPTEVGSFPAVYIAVPANQSVTIDLSGYSSLGLTDMWEFSNPAAVTGTVTIALQWFEQ
ncbi:MAG TPA: hypothetical protein VE998_01995 [Terriglobales bacterium]|nr:hypothetical protein [Terriglobales bacterium]